MSYLHKSILVIISFGLMSFSFLDQKKLTIGSKAPMTSHKMLDVSGRSISLEEVTQGNGLLVIFTSNTCPWVMKWEDRFLTVSSIAKANRIGMIAINSNENNRDKGDGLDDMVKRARKLGYDFPYTLDRENSVADAFGAKNTPEIFLFNSELELVFIGSIDDNPNNSSSVKEFYLKNAMEEMIGGEKLKKPITKSLGCSIKRLG